MGSVHWLALFALILCAWGLLAAMSVPTEIREGARIFGSGYLAELCRMTPDLAGFWRMVFMWALMSGAMMAPTALPAFATYEELNDTGATAPLGPLVLGYLGIWVGFAIGASVLQMALLSNGLISELGDSRSTALSVTLLLLAGIYQFTPLKDACLSKCRAPMMFFLQYFDEGPFKNGLRLGAVCLGCCWALMLLAFVGGVMSLGFMALAMVLMALEKLPDIGRWLTRPLGGALIIGAGILAVSSV